MNKTKELSELKSVIYSSEKKKDGALSARERIALLLDSGSFIETDIFSGREEESFCEGVITGYGTVDSRAVFVYAQDGLSTGAFGVEQSKKILKTINMAKASGAPMVALLDSPGIRLDDGMKGLSGLGEIYSEYASLYGEILTVTAVFGTVSGGAAVISGLSDFTIMTKNSRLMLNSDALCAEKGRNKTDVSSAEVNLHINGNADFVVDNENEAIEKIRHLISFLPGNKYEHAPCVECDDDLNRLSQAFDAGKADAYTVIKEIADNGELLPISDGYSSGALGGFIRINGRTVSVISSDGEIDSDSLKKAEKMISFSDMYSIPILMLCNTECFKPSTESERNGSVRNAAAFVRAFSRTKVPKVTLITGYSCTSAGLIFGSRAVGADLVIAWPDAVIGTVSPDMAGVLLYGKDGITDKDTVKERYKDDASAIKAARIGYIDDVVEPEATRPHIAAAFEMLYGKTRHSHFIKE